MTLPRPGQTVHLLSRLGVLLVIWDMHRKEGRNVRELRLYATDDLRQLYQKPGGDIISLRDGIITRVQLAAVIRWRLGWAAAGGWLLAGLSFIAAVAAIVAAWEGRATFR